MIVTRTPVVVPTKPLYLSMLGLIGVFGFFAQILMTMGFQIEAVGRASMGIYIQVIFTVILERAIFGTVPGLLSILGTCLILASAIYVTVTKAREGDDPSADGKITLPEGDDVEEGRAIPDPYEDSDTDVDG